MICSFCGGQIPDGARYCPKCGVAVSRFQNGFFCKKCGTRLRSGNAVCPLCGTQAKEEMPEDPSPINTDSEASGESPFSAKSSRTSETSSPERDNPENSENRDFPGKRQNENPRNFGENLNSPDDGIVTGNPFSPEGMTIRLNGNGNIRTQTRRFVSENGTTTVFSRTETTNSSSSSSGNVFSGDFAKQFFGDSWPFSDNPFSENPGETEGSFEGATVSGDPFSPGGMNVRINGNIRTGSASPGNGTFRKTFHFSFGNGRSSSDTPDPDGSGTS